VPKDTPFFQAQSFFLMVKPPPKFHVAALEGVQGVSLVAETFGTGDVLAVCTFTNVHRLAFCAWI